MRCGSPRSPHVAPNAGEPKASADRPESCAATVRSGDWIVGTTAVVVIPQEAAVEIANRAVDVAERENRIRERSSAAERFPRGAGEMEQIVDQLHTHTSSRTATSRWSRSC